jgi:hypothetical protein
MKPVGALAPRGLSTGSDADALWRHALSHKDVANGTTNTGFINDQFCILKRVALQQVANAADDVWIAQTQRQSL